jgi:transcriptional regulator with XRE-family HTH domain
LVVDPQRRAGVTNGSGLTIKHRILGRQLRQMREEGGYTLEQASKRMEWSDSKLSRIENGQQLTIDIHHMKSLLDLYDIGGGRWEQMLDLARKVNERGWWQSYGLGNQAPYIAYESEANRVQEFTLGYVPGLLQTANYARALFTAAPLPRSDSELGNAIAARMIRQQRLTSAENPLQLVAVIDESVLRRPIGGPDVYRSQLAHVAEVAELDTVTLHVLPTDIGAHAGIASGFIVLNFGDLGEPDIAYVEHALGQVMLEKDGDVARAKLAFEELADSAFGPAESLALIRRLIGEV